MESNSDMRILRLPDNFLSALRAEGQTGKKRLRIELYLCETIGNKAFAFHPKVLAPAIPGHFLNSSESAIKISSRSLVSTLQMHYVHEEIS
jgi:hypothetical protein